MIQCRETFHRQSSTSPALSSSLKRNNGTKTTAYSLTTPALANPSSNDLLMPFTRLDDDDAWELQYSSSSLVEYKTAKLDIFVGIFPRAGETHSVDGKKTYVDASDPYEYKREMMDYMFQDSTVLHCRVIPSTYHLRFTYSGMNQEQNIQILDTKDAEVDCIGSMQIHVGIPNPDWPLNITAPYYPNDEANQNAWVSKGARECIRQQSYAAVQSSIMRFIMGAEDRRSQYRGAVHTLPGDITTQVFSTVLANTREMQALHTDDKPSPKLITSATSGVAYDQIQAIMPKGPEGPLRTFKETFEELYFNVTMSMASSPRLIYNLSNPLAPEGVNVTFDIHGNVYSYAQDKLWLAYGLAIGVSMLNVVAGLWAVWSAGASNSATFSTIVRVARNADIGLAVHEGVLPGRDPLPKGLAKTELRISGRDGQDIKHVAPVEYNRVSPTRDIF